MALIMHHVGHHEQRNVNVLINAASICQLSQELTQRTSLASNDFQLLSDENVRQKKTCRKSATKLLNHKD